MALRIKNNIIPDLFNIANGVKETKKEKEARIESKKDPIESLNEIVKKKPKTKLVRKYFEQQVNIINENYDQQFYNDLI